MRQRVSGRAAGTGGLIPECLECKGARSEARRPRRESHGQEWQLSAVQELEGGVDPFKKRNLAE